MKSICLVFFLAVTGLGVRALISGELDLGHGGGPQQHLSGVAARIVAVIIIVAGVAFTVWTIEEWDRL
jgi:hypothetical protein